jgi:diketogulonate reductase-like aldo/keto reductase
MAGGMRGAEIAPGLTVPVIGQGTWRMGERPDRRKAEAAALRCGIDHGLTLIDTAEMYADGVAEEIVGEAITGLRDRITLVSKVYPHNATRRGTITACERSLRRLKTGWIDLYLLHWRGGVPLAETVAGLEMLVAQGKIRHYGVSNFDLADMADWHHAGGQAATNQVLYNLYRRGIEWDLLPWCQNRNMAVMAYSPIEQGRLLKSRGTGGTTLARIAQRHGTSSAAVALAWTIRHPHVVAIPKASSAPHVAENRAALDVTLDDEDLALLDQAFPPPRHAQPLAML